MLPTQKTKPITDLGRYATLIYGPPGSGKTTLASQYPDAVFAATERGCQALSVHEAPIRSWAEFLTFSADIASGRHGFKTVVIDTIDLLWKYCHEAMLQKLGQEIEKDDFGRTSTRIKNEFHREVAKLAALPYGLILVSHSTEREIEARTGRYTQITPSLAKAPRDIILGMMDLILYLEVAPVLESGRPTGQVTRRLRTKPSAVYDAKDRTGKLPDPIEPAYQALASAMSAAMPAAPAAPVDPIPLPPAEDAQMIADISAKDLLPPIPPAAPSKPAQPKRSWKR